METINDVQELYDTHEYLIGTTINTKYNNPKFLNQHILVKDDLYQHGRLGLHKACQDYDQTKKSSFKSFAIDNINWSIMRYCRQESLSREHSLTYETIKRISFDKTIINDDNEPSTMYDTYESPESTKGYYEIEFSERLKDLSTISERISQIVELKLEGYNNTEIARMLGTTPQNISTQLRNRKQEIKSLLFS